MEIQFPPGVVKTDSLAASVGRYVEANHIRWVGGHAEKIGGWIKLFPQKLEGIPRGSHVWRVASGLEVYAVGTDVRLYISQISKESNAPQNITPIRTDTTNPVEDPFTTIEGDDVVTVSHLSHGAFVNDTVIISGADPILGAPNPVINGSYKIFDVLGINAYRITVDQPAGSTQPHVGGPTVTLRYEVRTGTAGAVETEGYGVGPYGKGGPDGHNFYGTARDVEGEITPRYWSLDNYGTKLIAAYQGGTIYWWNREDNVRAVAIPVDLTDPPPPTATPPDPPPDIMSNRTPVPTDVIYVFVTEERFIFALRKNMVVSWPDQDNPQNWTPGLTSKANERRLAKGNVLIAGGSLGGGVSLVWSDTSLYVFQFTGGQFVYSSRMAGTNCGLVGPGAFCMAEGAAFWAGTNGFHIFNGSVQGIPNSDDIHAWFYGNMTPLNRRKTTCWYNAAEREVWWTAALGNAENTKDRGTPGPSDGGLYEEEPPSPGASEPTHYVFVNIDSWYWGAGELPRTSAAFSVNKGILLGSNDGFIYQHEVGVNAGGPNDTPSAKPLITTLKSGLYRIDGAEKNLDIFGFSPDFEWQVGDITGRVFTQDRPMMQPEFINNNSQFRESLKTVNADSESFTLTPVTGMKDIRVRGRYIGYELTQNVLDGYWRMGVPIAETQEAGSRR
jgi:hypothetical protein